MNDSLNEALSFLMVRVNDALIGAGISVSAGIDWGIVAALFVMGFAVMNGGLIFLKMYFRFVNMNLRNLPTFSSSKRRFSIFMSLIYTTVITSGVIYVIVMSFYWVLLHINQYPFQFLLIGGVICAAEWVIPSLMDEFTESVILVISERRNHAD